MNAISRALRRTTAAVAARAASALLLVLTSISVLAADPAAEVMSAAASAFAPASAAAAAADLVATEKATTLMVLNRPIVRFHVSLPGVPPADRARRARGEVMRVLQSGGPGVVTAMPIADGTFVLIDEIGVFPLMPGDLTEGQSVDNVVQALRLAVQEDQEARSLSAMLRAAGFALLATLVLGFALWLLRRMRRAMAAALTHLGERHSQRLALGGTVLLTGDRTLAIARTVTGVFFWLLLLVAF